MATALDDDVASLLAGLDGPESSQGGQPPAKRVKQERHEAGRQLASLNNLSVSSATSSMTRDELAARIRVKQEESVNSVEAAKRKLANLTNSISLGKQVESPRAADPPSYQQQQLTASVEQITPRNQEILKQLMVSSSNGQQQVGQQVASQQQQSGPQALNIASLSQGAILRHIQQSSHSQQQMQQQQQHSQQAQQQRQVQVVQQ